MTYVAFALLVCLCLLFFAIAVVASAVAVHKHQQSRADGFEQLVGQIVSVSLRDAGGSIKGVLEATYPNAFVIAQPEFIGAVKPEGLGRQLTIARSEAPVIQLFAETGKQQ